MIKEAVILAGGFGTRLQKVVSDVPKPMAPVRGRPFLEYVFNYLKNNGINHVVLSVGYLHQTIISHFGDEFNGIAVSYAIEKKPLGTGGAIRYAMTKLHGKHTAVVNGDTLFEVNLQDLWQKHQRHKALASLALRRVDEISRYGAVKTAAGGRITAFLEKGRMHGAGLINGGVYMMPVDFFEKINIFTDVLSLEKDIFEKWVHKGIFYGFRYDNYFIDIGIPEDYKLANQQLKI